VELPIGQNNGLGFTRFGISTIPMWVTQAFLGIHVEQDMFNFNTYHIDLHSQSFEYPPLFLGRVILCDNFNKSTHCQTI